LPKQQDRPMRCRQKIRQLCAWDTLRRPSILKLRTASIRTSTTPHRNERDASRFTPHASFAKGNWNEKLDHCRGSGSRVSRHVGSGVGQGMHQGSDRGRRGGSLCPPPRRAWCRGGLRYRPPLREQACARVSRPVVTGIFGRPRIAARQPAGSHESGSAIASSERISASTPRNASATAAASSRAAAKM